MSQQLDKFFREKLEGHKRPAPLDAWTRIEVGLSKKNNGKLWLRIAAAVLLVAAASFGIRTIVRHNDSTTLITEENTGKPSPNNQDTSAGQLKNSPPSANPSTTPPADDKKIDQKTESSGKIETAKAVTAVAEKIEEPVVDNDSTSTGGIDNLLMNSRETTLMQTAEDIKAAEASTNFKLVIEADEVNAKYLKKKYLAKATSKADSTSGIKKLLVKAQDLKNNQDPFGDLRQMKNEILALNFQGNKKQEQNK